jgi:hypothetical protein
MSAHAERLPVGIGRGARDLERERDVRRERDLKRKRDRQAQA